MERRRILWLAGGIGLVACGIVCVLRGSVQGVSAANTVLTLLADMLWAASILTLAIGRDRESSVVARKPLGLVASAVVAVWPLTRTMVAVFAVIDVPEQARAWAVWEYLSLTVALMSGLVAAMHVARADIVPTPWSRAPLWALGAQSAMWVLPQLIGAASPTALMEMADAVAALGTLSRLAPALGLGILAIVLANRSRTGTIPVFRSSTSE